MGYGTLTCSNANICEATLPVLTLAVSTKKYLQTQTVNFRQLSGLGVVLHSTLIASDLSLGEINEL